MAPLSPAHLAEITALAARYGAPARVEAHLSDGVFDPLTRTDRIGEVCMVIRRPNGRLLTMRKEIYPPGVFRLPTGGIAPDEPIEAGLLREVAEETSLEVRISRFLAVIAYYIPDTATRDAAFYTFAFLLDEQGGRLAAQDPHERVEAFREIAPDELPALAARLEQLEPRRDQAIGGAWRAWGVFRAVTHRVVAEALM
ncbi:MAG: NUDIX hydrolase [Oscillochloridaceae bacterium]|nr:NUDIX hydrolase [Chloroflexaceae bacterium]MDW8390294.1 NUDIX hydrolase [Oscillochloridaceae bacterium]